MPKLTLNDVTSGYSAATVINANNDRIETALENTLSRDGSSPNGMNANLDMNSNRVVNLGSPQSSNDAARWVDVTEATQLTGVVVPSQTGNSGRYLGTDGTTASWSNPPPYYERTTAEIAAGVTPTSYRYEPGDVRRYGAVGDGATNDATAFNNAASVFAQASGHDIIVPGGKTYLLSSQWTVNCPLYRRGNIWGYGAEITTSGSISGIQLQTKSTPHGVTIHGLKINHRGNSTATAGFDIVGTDHATLRDCVVEAHGVSATYAAYRLRNEVVSNADTGAFWTLLDNCSCRKRSGADSGDITRAIEIRGAGNATTVRGGSYKTATVGVLVTFESGQTYMPNAVLVDGAAFEGVTTAVSVVAPTGSASAGGMRVVNCRLESVTTFLSLSGTTVQPAVPLFAAGNYLTPDVATYISNTNNIYYYSLDSSTNFPNGPVCDLGGALALRGRAGTGTTLDVQAATSTSALDIRNTSGTLIGKVRPGTSGTRMRIQAQTNGELELIAVGGISANATVCNNLRGTVTLSSGTATVTFPTAETDANYYIALGGNANETFRWSGKGTGGFTITSSNASSTAVVDWIMIR